MENKISASSACATHHLFQVCSASWSSTWLWLSWPTKCEFINTLAIYQLCQSMPGTAQGQAGKKQGQTGTRQGQGRDKEGQTGTVPLCPYMSLSVPLCLYICCTFMSTHVDEFNSLHQYEHSYIDFPCKIHCSNACKPCV